MRVRQGTEKSQMLTPSMSPNLREPAPRHPLAQQRSGRKSPGGGGRRPRLRAAASPVQAARKAAAKRAPRRKSVEGGGRRRRRLPNRRGKRSGSGSGPSSKLRPSLSCSRRKTHWRLRRSASRGLSRRCRRRRYCSLLRATSSSKSGVRLPVAQGRPRPAR